MRGRPRMPTDTLKLHGGYRPDRHGAREEPVAGGAPVKPALKGEASAHWDAVVPLLVANGSAKAQDSASLQTMCEMWSLYRATLKKAEKTPDDKALRTAVLGYKQAWETLACKFGLTPSDRTRINVPPKKQQGIATRKRTG